MRRTEPHAHRAGGGVGPGVEAQHKVGLRLQHMVGQQGAGTIAAFLGGLEHQPHGAAELIGVLGQHPGRHQQGGGVQVVAAGVAHALVFRSKFFAGGLFHGQGVNVRPDGHHPACAGLFAVDVRHKAGLQAQVHRLNAGFGQLGPDERGRVVLLIAQLGVAVDLAAKLDPIRFILIYGLLNVHGKLLSKMGWSVQTTPSCLIPVIALESLPTRSLLLRMISPERRWP